MEHFTVLPTTLSTTKLQGAKTTSRCPLFLILFNIFRMNKSAGVTPISKI